mmetsp:Transcript_105532/g.145931  ORF Transcript_105532/g.145931 Transcript_105532/m.145931 type:complete len:134 (+) Transcript_105532:238-639(+)
MANHFVELGQFKSKVALDDFDASGNDKLSTCSFLFHLADISNACKTWNLCRRWTDLLFVEFFHQGDLEKKHKFTVSQFFDRKTTNIAKGQTGFIDFIIMPSFKTAVTLLPDLSFLTDNAAKNKETWLKMVDEY